MHFFSCNTLQGYYCSICFRDETKLVEPVYFLIIIAQRPWQRQNTLSVHENRD